MHHETQTLRGVVDLQKPPELGSYSGYAEILVQKKGSTYLLVQ